MEKIEWINEAELKRWLGIKSSSTIHEWKKIGRLVFAKVGDKTMYSKTHIEKGLLSQIALTKN